MGDDFFIRNYVNSGLIFWFVLFTILFAVVGYIWAALWVYGVLKAAVDFVNAFNDINVILSFVYYRALNDSLSGYTTRPEEYRKLHFEIRLLIKNFCSYTTVLLEKTKIHRAKIRDITAAMAFYSYRLYVADKEEMDFASIEISNNDLKNPQMLMLDLISQLNVIVREMEESDLVKSADVRQLSANIEKITRIIGEQDLGNNVYSPSYFSNHIRFVMGVYFLFYIPFRLAVAISWLTVLVYPIMMNILGGIVIIRYWLKDAFDKYRPWRGMDIEQWRGETIVIIDNAINATSDNNNTKTQPKRKYTINNNEQTESKFYTAYRV